MGVSQQRRYGARAENELMKTSSDSQAVRLQVSNPLEAGLACSVVATRHQHWVQHEQPPPFWPGRRRECRYPLIWVILTPSFVTSHHITRVQILASFSCGYLFISHFLSSFFPRVRSFFMSTFFSCLISSFRCESISLRLLRTLTRAPTSRFRSFQIRIWG